MGRIDAMNRLNYNLAALDMDGTLLNSDHRTTAFTRDALKRVAEAGGVLALCTGRCLSELGEHLRALPSVAYAICENGGSLYDVRADRVLVQMVIPDAAAERILALTRDCDVCVQCFYGERSHLQTMRPEDLERCHVLDFLPVFRQGSVETPDVVGAWRRSGQPMEKINLYFATARGRAQFLDVLGDTGLAVTGSLGVGCEISPPEATKGRGLIALCEHLGVPVARSMAVGDGGNDEPLMRAAGFSVAMGNAADAVKAAADAVTDDCDHDGAAKALLRYMLGRD
ncbi:MAG: HAD family phosphatase [Clostridia bacterium]|nr:HAD family phosphatase [Clostridia bacterium]